MSGIPWNTITTGETQIAERDGTVPARMTYEDGAGSIAGDVVLADPSTPSPPDLPAAADLTIHAVWHYLTKHGKTRYHLDKRRGRGDQAARPRDPGLQPPRRRSAQKWLQT